jgi:hypothetical protein
MERRFTLAEVRELLPQVKARAERLIPLRADLAERSGRYRLGDRAELPEVKALEARLSDLIDWFGANGIDVKGWAPLLVDFPVDVDGRTVLVCWLENEPSIEWYHEIDHGFAGRRPVADIEQA